MDNPPDKNNKTELIIGIIIFLLITLFVIGIIIGWYYFSSPEDVSQFENIVRTSGGFLSDCSNSICSTGYICDNTSFLCKLDIGSTCNDYSDCANESFCSGRCTNQIPGNLFEPCPCDSGLICVEERDGNRVCKYPPNHSCSNNNQCYNSYCLNGVCATGFQNSFPCNISSQCLSGNCNNGFCQPIDVDTGDEGASCAQNCVSYVGAVCDTILINPLQCICDIPGFPGTCKTINTTFTNICSVNNICSNQFSCINTNGNICTSSDSSCNCLFPYNNPNAGNNSCIEGMTLQQNNCYNDRGLGCSVNSNCISGVCNSPPVLSVYQFNNSSRTTNFMNTSSVSILPITITNTNGTISRLPSNLTIYKIFSISNDTIDNIFVVDQTNGLYSTKYDPVNKITYQSWLLLLPSRSERGSLIDVAYNNSIFVVVYNLGDITRVYSGTSINNLTPYGIYDGLQRNRNGDFINISYIDISFPNDASPGNDILLTSVESIFATVYSKTAIETVYNVTTVQGGFMNGRQLINGPVVSLDLKLPVKFYHSNVTERIIGLEPICPKVNPDILNPVKCSSVFNFAFIGVFNGELEDDTEVRVVDKLQFSGNFAMYPYYIDRFNKVDYRNFDFSIYNDNSNNFNIIMLSDVYSNNNFIESVVLVSNEFIFQPIAYRIGHEDKCLATKNAFYILSSSSCS